MTNAERIARDICLLVGQYERGEISAKEFVKMDFEINPRGCAGCSYRYINCVSPVSLTCEDGHEKWLDEEVDK